MRFQEIISILGKLRNGDGKRHVQRGYTEFTTVLPLGNALRTFHIITWEPVE